MKNNKVSVFLVTAGALLFNSIFWNEQLAVNALIFDAFIVGSLFYLYKGAQRNTTVVCLLLAHLVCLCTLIVFNSLLSKMAFSVTGLLLVAFTAYAHRSAWLAGGSLVAGALQFTGRFFQLLRNKDQQKQRRFRPGRFIRFAILPLLILLVFIIIYSLANAVFANFISNIGTVLQQFFSRFFELFSFNRLLFLLLGFFVTGSLLLRAAYTSFEKKDALAADDLSRIRKKRMDVNRNLWYDLTVGIMGKLARGVMALKNENKTGVTSLVLLNALLFAINLIDINYLWLHFTYSRGLNLSAMVHEGTELLILSIVLAMLLLLVFFRGNLNFYKKNKWLKTGAYIWLLQNTILVMSVLLRDYYYIREFGLTYKRIGVLLFLLLVLVGLFTVFSKVRYTKTNYYLLRVNAWGAVALLVLGSAVQWDVLIAKYNIAHRQTTELNVTYLLSLSDKVLPVLNDNFSVLLQREKQFHAKDSTASDSADDLAATLQARINAYKKEQEQFSWLSWNMTDADEKNYFRAKTSALANSNK